VIRAPRLAPGDPIRVIAPSGPVPREAFAAGIEILRARYDVRFDDGVFAREGYLAGPDERRLAELTAAFADPDARAIVMARGGYGLMRLLPFIDLGALVSRPRPIVGFSDGTALLALAARAGVASIHGPVVTQLGSLGVGDQGALFERLETPGPSGLVAGLDGLIPGRVQGPLIGGNLEVFSRLIGTPYLPDVAGAILFFEDLGERPYRIDRLLAHLDLAGIFSAVAGVIVGDFSGCREPEATRADSPTAEEVLVDRLGRLPIPVAVGGTFGHGTRNRALPYGVMCELDTMEGTLTALEGAVS
jgi:muramoyltetrapeptide carboxypeptidase